jgi:hypothetical protein
VNLEEFKKLSPFEQAVIWNLEKILVEVKATRQILEMESKDE